MSLYACVGIWLSDIEVINSCFPRASISFSPEEWKLFKSYFNLISSYFDGQVKQQCIECGNFRMHLTVSYGDYIVALEQRQEAEVANRKYHPLILQETTFAVLQEVSLSSITIFWSKALFHFNVQRRLSLKPSQKVSGVMLNHLV